MPGIQAEGAADERPIFEKTIETHALMIRSELIVNKAMEAAKLDKLPTLREEENPTEAIIENLSVTIREENTTILLVRYTGASPDDCQKVVHSISNAYKKFLESSSRGIDNDMATLIRDGASATVMVSLREQMRRLLTSGGALAGMKPTP